MCITKKNTHILPVHLTCVTHEVSHHKTANKAVFLHSMYISYTVNEEIAKIVKRL